MAPPSPTEGAPVQPVYYEALERQLETLRLMETRKPFTTIAQTIQVVVPDERHVARFGRALGIEARCGRQHQTHDQEQDVEGCAHGRVFYAARQRCGGCRVRVTTVSMCGV